MLNTNGLIVDSNKDLWALMSKNCQKIVVHSKMSTILSKRFRNFCMLAPFPCLSRAPILSNFPPFPPSPLSLLWIVHTPSFKSSVPACLHLFPIPFLVLQKKKPFFKEYLFTQKHQIFPGIVWPQVIGQKVRENFPRRFQGGTLRFWPWRGCI